MPGEAFGPSCALATLERRARLLGGLRRFLDDRGLLEVDVPALADATVTDPHLEPLQVGPWYLQTSPEYFLKRLLAAGAPALYYLGKAYRADEAGRRHRPEFTLLEWYCPGFDDRQLIAQVKQLLAALAPEASLVEVTYGQLFQACLGVDPHRADAHALRALARERLDIGLELDDKSAWLDLLFSHLVEPTLTRGFTIVRDYPAEQCALARLVVAEDGVAVARRFEVFGNGLELANGYWELTDAREQRQRFERDQRLRRARGLKVPAIDERFMAAMHSGLPACAGIAMGVDRLLMALMGSDDIAQAMPFGDG